MNTIVLFMPLIVRVVFYKKSSRLVHFPAVLLHTFGQVKKRAYSATTGLNH